MDPCDPCRVLIGASGDVMPHDKLKLLGSRSYTSAGFSNATYERYLCAACRTPLIRDLDKRDEYAIWEVEK